MSSLEESIYYKLSNDAPLVAIVPASRICHLKLVDTSALPAITFTRISTQRDYTLTDNINLTTADIQIDIFDKSDTALLILSNHVRRIMESILQETIQSVRIERALNTQEFYTLDGGGKIFRAIQTYDISYLG